MPKSTTKNDQTQLEKHCAQAFPAISVDWEAYAHHLDEADLSDEEKREFIETLWNLVMAFVDLGFGVHPVQQAQQSEACGQKFRLEDLLSCEERDVLTSYQNTQKKDKETAPCGSDSDAAGQAQ